MQTLPRASSCAKHHRQISGTRFLTELSNRRTLRQQTIPCGHSYVGGHDGGSYSAILLNCEQLGPRSGMAPRLGGWDRWLSRQWACQLSPRRCCSGTSGEAQFHFPADDTSHLDHFRARLLSYNHSGDHHDIYECDLTLHVGKMARQSSCIPSLLSGAPEGGQDKKLIGYFQADTACQSARPPLEFDDRCRPSRALGLGIRQQGFRRGFARNSAVAPLPGVSC